VSSDGDVDGYQLGRWSNSKAGGDRRWRDWLTAPSENVGFMQDRWAATDRYSPYNVRYEAW